MTNLNPSMHLKVKRDTFFVPDRNGGVYFRNNVGSFHMEGETVDQWIEQLLPMFDGTHSLEDLMDGLPEPYQIRILEIAEHLLQNGFVRDVSNDHGHQLKNEIVDRFASQIEFLDNLGGSGAHRFQSYLQTNVLAVGSGPFMISLISALFESGMSKVHVLFTDTGATDRARVAELVVHARNRDSEVELKEITFQAEASEDKERNSWRELVQPFDAIMYVSEHGKLDELRFLHAVCREEGKVFLPAIYLRQVGMAGPLVHSDSAACWESAIRRLHRSAIEKDPQLHPFSSTAGALLSNVIVFQLLKWTAGVVEPGQANFFFLLNLETLEGQWHSFLPHPLANGEAGTSLQWVQGFGQLLTSRLDKGDSDQLHRFFNQLTSSTSGIFSIWDEEDLKQLPLAQCRIQVVDPLSEGPAELLPDKICNGLTHEEARREAGLCGIETYVSHFTSYYVQSFPQIQDDIGIGAGTSEAEGVCRGLQHYLEGVFEKKLANQKACLFQIKIDVMDDERCRFYFQCLVTMHNTVIVRLGEEVLGFPVMWVQTNGNWYGSVGLNLTMALRRALQRALLYEQNQAGHLPERQNMVEVSSDQAPRSLTIALCEEQNEWETLLQAALQVIKSNSKRLSVLDLAVNEPFLTEELAGVFGVWLQEEASQ